MVKTKTAPYILKFPLNDSNKTDWKGLEQYCSYVFGKDDSDRLYALKEVGNIFPKWVRIGPSEDEIPPYIPRVKNMVAVQYRGYHAWHQYGFMTEEERMAVLKRYTGAAWVEVASTDSGFDHYTTSWQDIKWGKYYDGAAWQSFWTLIPSGFLILATAAVTGWTNRTTTIGDNKGLYCAATRGNTGGATSHSHSNSNISLSTVRAADHLTLQSFALGTSSATQTHTHATSTSHAASSVSYYPDYVYYRVYQTPGNANTLIPSGAICFWSGTTGNVPTGWTYISASNGYYLTNYTTGAGDKYSGTDAGHAATGTSNSAVSGSNPLGQVSGTQCGDDAVSHTHNFSSTSHTNGHKHSGSNASAYFNVILMSADSETAEFPVDGVTPFWDAPGTIPGTTWTRVSAADDHALLAASSYGGTGGSTAHAHSHTGLESATASISITSIAAGSGIDTITGIHAHTITGSDHPSAAANSMAPYYSVLLYERTA